MIKKILILLSLSILCGCTYEGHLTGVKPNSEILIYQDFNAKETYDEAIKFFNENTYYYKEYIEKDNTDIINTYYKDNNGIYISELNIYSDQGLNTLSYTCAKDQELHVVYLGENDLYRYEKYNDNYLDRNNMYLDITQKEGYRMLSIDRKDINNEVILTLKVEDSHTYNMGGTHTYLIKDIYIDKTGYIYKENISFYDDINCKTETQESMSIYYKKINKPVYENIDEEIQLLSLCDQQEYNSILEIISK